MTKINNVISEEDLQNISGGMKFNLKSTGARDLLNLIQDPELGSHVAEFLVPTSEHKIPDQTIIVNEEDPYVQAVHKIARLMVSYPDLFELSEDE